MYSNLKRNRYGYIQSLRLKWNFWKTCRTKIATNKIKDWVTTYLKHMGPKVHFGDREKFKLDDHSFKICGLCHKHFAKHGTHKCLKFYKTWCPDCGALKPTLFWPLGPVPSYLGSNFMSKYQVHLGMGFIWAFCPRGLLGLDFRFTTWMGRTHCVNFSFMTYGYIKNKIIFHLSLRPQKKKKTCVDVHHDSWCHVCL